MVVFGYVLASRSFGKHDCVSSVGREGSHQAGWKGVTWPTVEKSGSVVFMQG